MKNASIKCRCCGELIPEGAKVCPECKASISGKVDKAELFAVKCEVCGITNGREIAKDGKTCHRCYDCYEKEIAKNFYQPKHGGRDWTPAYKALIEGYREYYHKPLFYGEQPNKAMIKHLEEMEVHERLSGVTAEREKNPNRKFVPSTSLSNIAKGISAKILISEAG